MLIVALFVFVVWIASVCLHEFGHALVAYWGGDRSVKDKGYLTLNPLKYTDLGTSLVMPLIFLMLGGIPLPGAAVYIDSSKLRGRLWKSAVSLAGPLMTAMVALVLASPFWLGWAPGSAGAPAGLLRSPQAGWIWPALAFLVTLEVAGVVINLLPVPPLDGYGILEPWLPETVRRQLNRWSRYSMIALFGILWTVPAANRALWRGVDAIATQMGVPAELSWLGYSLFRQWGVILLLVALAIAAIVLRRSPQFQNSAQYWGGGEGKRDPSLDRFYASVQYLNYLVEQQRYDAAIALCDQAIKCAPHRYEPWQSKGNILLKAERYAEALAAYDQAIALAPDFYGGYHGRALALRHLQPPQAALAAFDDALQRYESDPNLWSDRGSLLYELQRYEDTIDCYTHAIALEPDNALFHYNLACCHALLGDAETALDCLKRAIALNDLYRAIAKTDSDFNTLHPNPMFQSLLLDA
ncbi:TPR end-of-group domain-containing protein [Thermoleptolyngbya sp.]